MKRPLILFAMAPLVAVAAAQLPDRNQVTALSRTFLRDSTELPMDVAVQTKVTDAKGRKKRDAHSNVQVLFNGYNRQSEGYSFRSKSGFTGFKILHDSLGSNFVVIDAFRRLAPHGTNPADVTIEPGTKDGSFVIRSDAPVDCQGFKMQPHFLYPEHCCYSVIFHVTADPGGKLVVQDFAVDIDKLPAAGNVRYLGLTEVRKIHSDGQVQEASFGGDPHPFLIPKHITTTIETSKGTVVLTSDYALHTATK
jgi:hypothetical protein